MCVKTIYMYICYASFYWDEGCAHKAVQVAK